MQASECLDDDTIAGLLGKALDATRIAQVEAHLDSCADCRRHVSDLARGSAPQRGGDGTSDTGRYVIESLLGRGGMGAVYAARDPALDRKVAIKLLHRATGEAARERLRREAQAMAKLAHPNVVAIYDVGLDGAQVFVAMELVEGATLAAWARDRAAREILHACIQAGRGLAAAHAIGLVHRDVTPRNILVGRDGRARVSDFGLVRSGGDAPGDDPHLTQSGEFVGTPAYAPPEAFRGEPCDERGDQWSFAATAWHVLYGAPPFAGATFGEVADAVAARRLAEPRAGRRVPARVRAVLARALSLDPAARFPSIDAMLAALEPRRRWLWLAAVPVAAVALWLALVRSHAACEAPPNSVWTDAHRATILRAFSPQQAAALDRAFTSYVERAAVLYLDACETAKSPELRAARDRCVTAHLATVAALRDQLAGTLDVAARDAAVLAAARLAPLEPCSDTVALARPAADPELRARFAKVDALNSLGRYTDAIGAAREALAVAPAAHRGEALYFLADAQDSAGDPETARATLAEAGKAAAAAHDDARVAAIWLELLYIVGSEENRPREALDMLPLVTAAVERAGDRALEGRFHSIESGVLEAAGRLDEARQRGEQAIEMLVAQLGPDHLDVAKAQLNLASLDFTHGTYDEGHALTRRAIATLSKLLGPDHSLIARAIASEGHAYADEDRWPLAEAALTHALASLEQTFGKDHIEVAWTLREFGHLEASRGRPVEALAYYQRALPVFEHATGADSGDVASLQSNIGITLVQAGRCTEARPQLEHAIELVTQAYGPDRVELAEPLSYLAQCVQHVGNQRAADALADRALALHGEHDDPIQVADRTFRIAQLIAPSQPARARKLALAARAAYVAGEGETHRYDHEIDQVDSWLTPRAGAN